MIINTKLIPPKTKRRSGIKMEKVKFVVLHDTGNANSTAQNNVDYYCNSCNEQSASAHIFVDDIQSLMCIPCFENVEKAWHVLYEKPYDNQIWGCDANDCAIGVELCYFPNDKERSMKSYNRYVETVAYIMDYHRIGVSCSGHEQLDPQRKTDPSNALKYIGKTYKDLVNDITIAYNKLQKDIDYDNAISKLNSKGIIGEIDKWSLDSVKVSNVKYLMKSFITNTMTQEDMANILKLMGVISSPEVWESDDKIKQEYIRNLIINMAGKIE